MYRKKLGECYCNVQIQISKFNSLKISPIYSHKELRFLFKNYIFGINISRIFFQTYIT